jgi:hypothetical protein
MRKLIARHLRAAAQALDPQRETAAGWWLHPTATTSQGNDFNVYFTGNRIT